MFLTQTKTNYDIYIIVAALTLLGIVMIIVNGAFYKKTQKAKAIAGLITCLVYILVFTAALLYDKYSKYSQIKTPIRYYLYFIGAGILYLISFVIPKLFTEKRIFSIPKVDKKMVYTYKPKEEYLYVVLKCNQYIYLNAENNKGIEYKLKNNEFADDALNKLFDKFNIDTTTDVDRLGLITVKEEKKDIIYYCYIIELDDLYINSDYKPIHVFNLGNIDINDIDKYIILNCLSGEEFDKVF